MAPSDSISFPNFARLTRGRQAPRRGRALESRDFSVAGGAAASTDTLKYSGGVRKHLLDALEDAAEYFPTALDLDRGAYGRYGPGQLAV
jgi:hypothetical protein